MDSDEAVAGVRRFNRIVTQRIGVLNDEYLARARPLGGSRVLWEIGADGSDVRTLRTDLDLDSGYLSRILRSLEEDGLVVLEPEPSDRRVRRVKLTASGLAERDALDRGSDALARSLLTPLNEAQRLRLVDAMESVERLLTAGLVEIDVEDPTTDAARFCIESYFAEIDSRFEAGFDPAISATVDVAELVEPAGLFLVARLRREPVGCGALRFRDPDWAEIKRMWVAPTVRGLGVGRRILTQLEKHARHRDAASVRLDTNRTLEEAIGLYRSAGYVEIDRYNDEHYAHHWFEKDLAG